ncbi:MAG: 30S ribosomal protein S18 [Myxococcales bacterium]|jgi:small subunit ribosomal protein S18|nr:30S ribosomal protein S18 [Myxococcales bacterium]
MGPREKDDFEDSPVEAIPGRSGARRGKRLATRLGIGSDFRFDYKDVGVLRYFVTERGKIIPRRISGLSARQQRDLALAVKRAQNIALLPFTEANPRRL